MIAEMAGTANRMKAQDACLPYTVRLIGIKILELYVMSVSRGARGMGVQTPCSTHGG
jgi:hypothetical protein